jgi:phosphohistidine phosphatase
VRRPASLRPPPASHPIDRHLLVMRHAKAEPAEGAGDDHARTLTDRGRRDARRIADRLAAMGWTPERVVHSDSARTRETWINMADRLPSGIEVLSTHRLFQAEVSHLVDVLGEQPASLLRVMVVGHNPGLEEWLRRMTTHPTPLSTAWAVLLTRAGSDPWGIAAAAADWQTVAVLRPNEE